MTLSFIKDRDIVLLLLLQKFSTSHSTQIFKAFISHFPTMSLTDAYSIIAGATYLVENILVFCSLSFY